MKKVMHYKGILIVLAIVTFFSTVAPVPVFSQERSFITTVSFSSENTGGVTLYGADGIDGVAGKDGSSGVAGKDGSSGVAGKDGTSSVTVHSTGSALIHTTSLTAEESISLDSENTTVLQEAVLPNNATGTVLVSTETTPQQIEGDVQTSADEVSPITLKKIFFSFQLMLASYVNFLF
jgi:hypothetical protein